MATKSSGYDVKAVHLTADTQALDADGISAAAAVGNNAALTIGGALASGGSCTFDAGRASAADVVFGGRSRFQGINLVCTGTAGVLNFLTTSPTGTSIYKVGTVASATATRDLTIPDEGMVFSAGIYVQYTVSTFNTLTVFHA